ncbi:hypothetical protein NQZ79_g4932 [Umbelopsis isabellina]|nr:hypothetical protein NQZ79_g4932 [Umbelopsis isabellina]
MVKSSFILAAAASAFLTFVQAKSDVVDLDAKSFDKHVQKEDLTLVEFFAPWCGHCKALAPEWEKAATELSGTVKLAKVDCTVEQDICTGQDVKGYPTIKVFRNGVPSEYGGPRQADGIVSYMKKQMLPAVSKLDAKSYKDFQTTDKLVVIGYISSKDKESQEIYEELANQLRDDYTFGLVTDKKAIAAEGYEGAPKIVMYKEKEPSLVYDKEIDSADIASFIRLNALPTFGDIDGSNFASYADLGLPIAYCFYADKEQAEELDTVLRPIAEKYHGKLSFVKIDGSQFSGHAEQLSIPTDFPSFGVQKLDDASKYPLIGKKATDVEAVDALAAAVANGSAQPHLKSAPIPESNDEPVKVIVGEQFDEIVLNKDQHVFLEVYAPWCGHCKNLAPIWEELAQHYVDDKNIVIAKLDGTENDLPASAGLKIEGFPTLVLYKKGTNELINYNGARSLEELKEFIDALDATEASSEEAAPEAEAAPKAAEESHDEL